ncbi:hypothetical protein E2I00_005079, partial [Balaenoptera physalus]
WALVWGATAQAVSSAQRRMAAPPASRGSSCSSTGKVSASTASVCMTVPPATSAFAARRSTGAKNVGPHVRAASARTSASSARGGFTCTRESVCPPARRAPRPSRAHGSARRSVSWAPGAAGAPAHTTGRPAAQPGAWRPAVTPARRRAGRIGGRARTGSWTAGGKGGPAQRPP